MRVNKFVSLGTLILTIFYGTPLHAAENTSESDQAYRRTALETLVAESQREKTYPRRHFPHDLDYFNKAENPDPTELEPPSRSFGDVIGA